MVLREGAIYVAIYVRLLWCSLKSLIRSAPGFHDPSIAKERKENKHSRLLCGCVCVWDPSPAVAVRVGF